jgi:sucrose-6-phosphate hydrolase SacC (GH32 family)
MPLPREIYAGPEGLLYMKPVEEVIAVYKHTVADLSGKPAPKDAVEVPRHYMLDARVKLEAKGSFSLALGGQYRFTLDAAAGTMSLAGPGYNRTRSCRLDASKPVKVQIFTEGTLIECFVNDQFAQSCVIKTPLAETLGINADGANIDKLKILSAHKQ